MIDFSTEKKEETLYIELHGDLDIDGTEKIENELVPILEKQKEIFLDFSDVPFVDSSGIGLLIHLIESLKEQHITIKLYNIREDVLSVFTILQVSEIIGEDIIVTSLEA
ncbi:STAS domain-containing protein [Alkalicoccobacillus murimartini]|uniref:Anti-sigma factor antagonist n=1 Tax=Alkalicoccobacillus murimartini TaxID=171685 RepID=A0ABT9YJ40_9BACI|nr:STAS domain-containing protein [Alkalicoccobacillus murimartini]MDQ0207699.1 anti-anti-sigma factor [Alkalicoccobacillus murimartini]